MLGITRQSDIRGSDSQIKISNNSLLKLSEIDTAQGHNSNT